MAIKVLSADLDGTLLGSREAEGRFLEAWTSIDESRRPLLVFNSGRLLDDIQQVLPETNLPQPDILIGGVGTMLFHFGRLSEAAAYRENLGTGFDWAAIEALLSPHPRLELQPMKYQSPLKSSWYLTGGKSDDLHHIETLLSDAGLKIRLIYSSNRDLDILPRGVDKGSALAWLCLRLGVDLADVLVAGDTNNDRSMFELPGVSGIVVANAHEELLDLARRNTRIYRAKGNEGFGVVEGLAHFGLLAKPLAAGWRAGQKS